MRRLLILALLALPSTALAAPYSIVDLGTLGGPASRAHALNAAGWVVGEALTAQLQNHAFLYRDGRMTDLDVPGGMSVARAINGEGQVAGSYYGRSYQAFLRSGSETSELGDLGVPYTVTYALNPAGHAAGSSYTSDRREHAFLWSGHAMVDLGTLGGSFSTARGINSNDRVVGYSFLPTGIFHAFIGDASGLTDLGTLGGHHSVALAINDLNQVAGFSFLEGDTQQHACLWTGGTITDLGDLGARHSEAFALDPTGSRVVGKAMVAMSDGRLEPHAFLWSKGAMRDLNDLIPAGTGWVLEEATGVNESGQIAGSGTYQGQHRAFLLQPESPADNPPMLLPAKLTLSSAIPNPARGPSSIDYALPHEGDVTLIVVNAAGRTVRTLARGHAPGGRNTVGWDLRDDAGRLVGSGVYFIRLTWGQETQVTRAVVER